MVNLEQTLGNMVRHQTNLNSNENGNYFIVLTAEIVWISVEVQIFVMAFLEWSLVISSLDNEEHIWKDAIPNARTRDEANAAEGILEIVKGINAELK